MKSVYGYRKIKITLAVVVIASAVLLYWSGKQNGSNTLFLTIFLAVLGIAVIFRNSASKNVTKYTNYQDRGKKAPESWLEDHAEELIEGCVKRVNQLLEKSGDPNRLSSMPNVLTQPHFHQIQISLESEPWWYCVLNTEVLWNTEPKWVWLVLESRKNTWRSTHWLFEASSADQAIKLFESELSQKAQTDSV